MGTGYEDVEDPGLIAGLSARRHVALREVFDRHGAAIHGVAARVLREPALAEDVTQEVLLRLWRNPARYDPGRGSLRAYLLRDAHGRAVDLIRAEEARRVREERDHRLSSGEAAGPEQEVWERVRSHQVRVALESLPERERSAVALAFFEGLSYRQVAERLGEAEGTVKSRIRAGLKRLHGPLSNAGLVEQ